MFKLLTSTVIPRIVLFRKEVVVLWRVTGTHLGPLLLEVALTSRRSVWVELSVMMLPRGG